MGWLVDILKVGHPMSDKDPSDTDGFISSLLTLVVLTGLGTSVSLSHWVTVKYEPTQMGKVKEQYSKNECTAHIILTVYILLAISSMITLLCSSTTSSRFSRPLHRIHKNVLVYLKNVIITSPSIFALHVFFILVVILHVSVFVVYVPCLGKTPTWSVKCAIVPLYDLVHFIFMVFLFFFCTRYHSCTVQRHPLIRYGLVIVLAATISVWFDGTISTPFYNDDDRKRCFSHCIGNATNGFNLTTTIGVLLYPLQTQFLTMSVKIILELFLNAVTVEHFMANTAIIAPNVTTQTPSTSDSGEYSTERGSNIEGSLDENSLVESIQQQSTTSDNTKPTTYHQSELEESWIPETDQQSIIGQLDDSYRAGRCFDFWNHPRVTLPLILFLHAFFATFVILHQLYDHLTWFNKLYAFILLGAETLFCVVSITGLYAVHRFRTDQRPYTGLEMYVLFTSISIVVIAVFTWVCDATLVQTKPDLINDLPFSIVAMLVFFVGIFFQTLLMFRATRAIIPRFDDEKVTERDDSLLLKKDSNVFHNVVFFLTATNLLNWVFQAVMQHPLYGQHVIEFHNEKHDIASHVLHPLCLFYSFNISLTFFGIYLKKCTIIHP